MAAGDPTSHDPPQPVGGAIKVVVVDDHSILREGTADLLDRQSDLDVVGQAANAEEGLVLIERVVPDVAIVDLNLPGMSGLELAQQLRSRLSPTRVLILSAYDDFEYLTEAMNLSVAGYLLKTTSSNELIDAVRAVAHGIFVLDRTLSEKLARRPARDGAHPKGAEELTPREADVLALLAMGRSNKQIAAEMSLGLRTVEGYVSKILAKLGASSRTEAALRAIGRRETPPRPRP